MSAKRMRLVVYCTLLTLLVVAGCGSSVDIPGLDTGSTSSVTDLSDGHSHGSFRFRKFMTPDGEIHCINYSAGYKGGLSCWPANQSKDTEQ
ncbi:hypothetical protein [Bifidobacterium sp. SO1]|uniref:hypothetical protein n=1 Tax=Bifidobacterium sp. SO1 TaxID=2809029 RepID=UPI001BDD7491|nr:hypothetical protein [Bifidobacterium sp. SO1]MBT1162808.1 hypothetical protein [Bifidobacterium sp. SO1]